MNQHFQQDGIPVNAYFLSLERFTGDFWELLAFGKENAVNNSLIIGDSQLGAAYPLRFWHVFCILIGLPDVISAICLHACR
jgi:hypothetical protein